MTGLNVTQELKTLTKEEINEKIDPLRQPYGICMFNFAYNINIGTTIRSANAFGASEVIYVGRKPWDRRGAVGMHHYTPLTHYRTWEEVKWNGPKILVDNIPGSKCLFEYEFPKNPLFVFGREADGVPTEVAQDCDDSVYLPQIGAARSINVANAAAIVMSHWISRNLF